MIARAIVLLLLLLVLPGSASAATRYVTPNGASSGTCAEASPCDLPTAISMAGTGDTVSIAADIYEGVPAINVTKSITIQGAVVGAGRPVLNVSGDVKLAQGARLSDVELSMTGKLDLTQSSRADRVIARTLNTSACSVQGSTLTNSLCTAPTINNAIALSTPTQDAVIRNVTAYGVTGFFVTPGTDPTATSSAFEGTGTEDVHPNAATLDHDLFTTPADPAPATSTDRVVGHGTYVDKVTFVPKAGSLTVDKGAAAPVGELDLNGNLRTINGKTDIGAYELPPKPAVTAGTGTTSTADTVTFKGTTNDGGGVAKAYYEYGPNFGSPPTPAQAIAATLADTPVTATVPWTNDSPMPYRLVVTTDGGTTRSADLVAYRAPTLAAAAPTDVTDTTATLNGTVALKGAPSGKVEFVYGSATSAPQTITADGPVSQALTGLTPRTTYQWKLRVTRGTESFETPVGTFTTAAVTPTGTATPTPSGEPTASPSPTTTATPSTPPNATFSVGASASARRKAGRLLLSRRTLTVSFRCGDAACSAKASGTVTIGRKRYGVLAAPKQPLRLEAGEKGKITLAANKRLVRRVKRYLKRHPKAFAKIHLKGAFVDADGTKMTKAITIKVRRSKR